MDILLHAPNRQFLRWKSSIESACVQGSTQVQRRGQFDFLALTLLMNSAADICLPLWSAAGRGALESAVAVLPEEVKYRPTNSSSFLSAYSEGPETSTENVPIVNFKDI